MKRKFTCLLILFLSIYSYGICSTISDVSNLNAYHKIATDTLDKFIIKFGKDSLFNKIDNTIGNTVLWLNDNSQYKVNATSINKLLAVGKKFNLGFDTLFLPQYNINASIYQLYDFKEGAVVRNAKALDSLKKANANIEKLMFDNMHYELSRNSCVVLLDTTINIKKAYFDSIYSKYFNINADDFIEPYWIFTQFALNQPTQSKVPMMYKNKVFTQLYKEYNFAKTISEFQVMQSRNQSNIVTNIKNPITVLAYGLYGGDLNINTNGADLFYLLQTINSKGNAWQQNIGNVIDDNYETTLYALWALCEFKQQLINYKTSSLPTQKK